MKVTSKALGIFLTISMLALSTACASSQQDEEDLELSDDENSENQQGNLGEDDAAEGNGQENFENEENSNENEQGAEVNSETSNEFDEGTELTDQGTELGNQTTQGNAMFNNGGANPAGMNTSAPVETAAPMNAGMAAPAASDKAPIPGGRVRYVREGGVQVMSGPGGAPVAALEQGDHPVTWEENGWLRISTGMYVPVDAMSDKGVPRVMGQKGWN